MKFPEFMTALRADYQQFVASESLALRRKGTQSRTSRIRMIKLLFLTSAYDALDNWEEGEADWLFEPAEMQEFVDIVNFILGTEYVVEWYLPLVNPSTGEVLLSPMGQPLLNRVYV